jgi:hypothetical protein
VKGKEKGEQNVDEAEKERSVEDEEKGEVESLKVEEEFGQEGGLRAWLAVAGSTLVLMCTFGVSNSFATFLSYYREVRPPLAPPQTPSSHRTSCPPTPPPPFP